MARKRGKPRKLTIRDDELVKLYTKDLVQVQEIARRYGVTRQTVWYRVRQLGIRAYKRKTQHIKCPNCGEMFDRWPTQGAGKYCSRRCYHENTSIYGKYSRAGQRKGREVAGAKDGEIVHHVNGDCTDNRAENLLKFPDHAAHMSFHKSGAARMLKEKIEAGELTVDGLFIPLPA